MNDKEFWEKCGFEQVDYLNTSNEVCASHFVSPDKTWGQSWYPPFDLNNLFKHAVPKIFELLGDKRTFMLLVQWVINITGNYEEDVQALRKAIEQVWEDGC